MSHTDTSFEFHRDLESLGEFCRREWRSLLFFGLGFTALLVTALLLIDESFFYSRIQTDALLYYLKGKAFVETGSSTATLAVNVPPFAYAAMPGVLRSPMIRAFSEFDDRLRAIQLVNVVFLDAVIVMSAYILSWVLPRKLHWVTIAFSFAFAATTPWWMTNVYVPLTDAPYAAFSLVSVLFAIQLATSRQSIRKNTAMICALGFVFVVAFTLRYTEPVVLILIAVLLKGRLHGRKLPVGLSAKVMTCSILGLGLLVTLNRQAIFHRYLIEELTYLAVGEKQSMFLNFFCVAVPQQIIPAFEYGFTHPPIRSFTGEFAGTPKTMAWSAFGFLISMIVVAGAWRTRDRLVPEILFVAAALPLLILLMPSTPRYLMTYQAFFWIWFYTGSRAISELIPQRSRAAMRPLATLVALSVLVTGLSLGMRTRGFFGRQGERSSSLATFDLMNYVRAESDTYRPLERFLRSLPRGRTLLVAPYQSLGRWKAIANLDYYFPDSGTTAAARSRDMYMIIDCGSYDTCETFPRTETDLRKALAAQGSFTYQLVFEATAAKSHARVYRVRPSS